MFIRGPRSCERKRLYVYQNLNCCVFIFRSRHFSSLGRILPWLRYWVCPRRQFLSELRQIANGDIRRRISTGDNSDAVQKRYLSNYSCRRQPAAGFSGAITFFKRQRQPPLSKQQLLDSRSFWFTGTRLESWRPPLRHADHGLGSTFWAGEKNDADPWHYNCVLWASPADAFQGNCGGKSQFLAQLGSRPVLSF